MVFAPVVLEDPIHIRTEIEAAYSRKYGNNHHLEFMINQSLEVATVRTLPRKEQEV